MTRPAALITGAASGIGAGVARRLSSEGFQLFLLDRVSEVVQLARELTDSGGSATGLVHDLCDVDAAPAVVEKMSEVCGGRIDALVSSAGVSMPRRYDEVTPEDWDRIFNVNAKGMFFLTAAVARHMVDRGAGSIVSISSISGKGWKEASSVPYGASKAAIIGMSRLLAAEMGPHGVRVNTVCPGITKTEMMAAWSAARAEALGVDVDDFVASRVQDSALGRPSEVGDIASMVSFLVSAESANVTGQSFNVDGGSVWD